MIRAFTLTFKIHLNQITCFFSGHSCLLDDINKYLIESQCGSSLAFLLHQSMVSSGSFNEANLAFGLGCAILSNCAISYAMGIFEEEAFELTDQGLLCIS